MELLEVPVLFCPCCLLLSCNGVLYFWPFNIVTACPEPWEESRLEM